MNISFKNVTKEEYKEFFLTQREVGEFDAVVEERLENFVNEYEDDEMPIMGIYGDGILPLGMFVVTEEDACHFFDLEEDEMGEETDITYIDTMCVHSDFRNKGIGKRIIEYVIEQAETNWIHASPNDENARRFFMSVGFDGDNQGHFAENDNWEMFYQKNK